MEIEVGQCYCQHNPLWGRNVIKVNRELQSSVLDFERYDVTLIKTADTLELHEHQVLPATVFTHTSYEPIPEELFLKLFAMARLARAASQANGTSLERDQKEHQQVESLLRDYGIIDDTPPETFAQQYAQGMKNLLDGVYDVVDVHK